MRKLLTLALLLTCIFTLAGCSKDNSFKIRITVPANSQEKFVFSEEEISATGDKIIIHATEGLGDTEVILAPVNDTVTPGYVPTYLTQGMPAEFDAVKGEWFTVGVNIKNDTDKDRDVYVRVEGVEVRIE